MSELAGVNQGETEGGDRHRSWDADSPSQYWIEESAKVEFLHERRQSYAEQGEHVGACGIGKKLFDGKLFRYRQQAGRELHNDGEDQPENDEANPFRAWPIPTNTSPKVHSA